jgi:hypothetical protein
MRISRKRVAALVSVLTAVTIVSAGAVSAAQAEKRPNGQGALVGTWNVRFSIPGTPPARVLATFNRDGTTVESAAAPPTSRGASHGVWKRSGPYLFSVTRVFFRFEDGGAFLGTQKVNATVRVAADRQTFSAVSISELRDPAGNVVFGLRGTAQATRMRVEEILDQQ